MIRPKTKCRSDQPNNQSINMKAIIYRPPLGAIIDRACSEAVARSVEKMTMVELEFNGIEMVATSGSSPSMLKKKWSAKMHQACKAYQESPGGIKAKQDRDAEATKCQDSVTALIRSLPGILAIKDGDLPDGATRDDALMGWLTTLTIDGGHIGVDWNAAAGLRGGGKELVAVRLQAAGFRENEHVGEKPEWFNSRPRMAQYIVGQVINMLRHGMDPHPVTERFIEQYFTIPRAS